MSTFFKKLLALQCAMRTLYSSHITLCDEVTWLWALYCTVLCVWNESLTNTIGPHHAPFFKLFFAAAAAAGRPLPPSSILSALPFDFIWQLFPVRPLCIVFMLIYPSKKKKLWQIERARLETGSVPSKTHKSFAVLLFHWTKRTDVAGGAAESRGILAAAAALQVFCSPSTQILCTVLYVSTPLFFLFLSQRQSWSLPPEKHVSLYHHHRRRHRRHRSALFIY